MTGTVLPDRDELCDLLADLQHDLGKYLRLPLSMLPRDAESALVREALSTALLETRRSPAGARSAREIWEAFLQEARGRFSSFLAFGSLETAVGRALAWRQVLDKGAPIDRAALESDLGAVSVAIRALLKEVQVAR